MFDDSVISPLMDRLGWSELDYEIHVKKLDDQNKIKNSGMTLNGFHGMVSLKGIFDSMPMDNPTNEQFNRFLRELLQNTIREILTDVYLTDDRSQNIDYTGAIAEATALGVFDNCIGYCHAVKVLQLLISTLQSNRTERRSKDMYAEMVLELKGVTDMRGVLVSKGLIHYCMENRALIKEKAHEVADSRIENATNHW